MDRIAPDKARAPWLLRLFPAFESYDFRWLWSADALGAVGMSMEMLAQGWLVLEVTDSPFWVGAVAGLRGAGLVVFGALGGVIADRVDRQRALVLIQILRGTVVLGLGLLTVTGRISLVSLLAAALVQGLLQAVALPVRNALTYDTAGRSRLLNAMAARLTAFNLARIGGSVLAGILISRLGVGWCYLALSIAFFMSPVALLFMRGSYRRSGAREPIWRNLREGMRYALSAGPVGSLLLLSLLMEMFGFSYMIMLPVIARDVLQVGGLGLGLLGAAGGMGAMVGTLTVASLGDFRTMGSLMAGTAAGAGLCLLLFALLPWLPLSLALAALIGCMLMAYDATMSTLLQLLSSDAMRGRVMGLYGLTFGFSPMGGFVAGVVATAVSAPFAVGLGGVVILAWLLRIQGPVRRIRSDSVGAAYQVPGGVGDEGEASEGHG